MSDRCISTNIVDHTATATAKLRKVGSFWLECNPDESKIPDGYILTESVKTNLENLSRAISARYDGLVGYVQIDVHVI